MKEKFRHLRGRIQVGLRCLQHPRAARGAAVPLSAPRGAAAASRLSLGAAGGRGLICRFCFLSKELEQMAREQDKESEKQALLQEVENHKKQMLR